MKTWLQKLVLFHGVPFNHLIPNEDLLPTESIRFFFADPNWLCALIDGACSMGRTNLKDSLKNEGVSVPDFPVAGFFLRSHLVAGWPGLAIKAYSSTDSSVPLPFLRKERLAKDVLLCLFSEKFELLELQEPGETLHFGADFSNGGYTKELRSLQSDSNYISGETIKNKQNNPETFTVPMRETDNSTRVVDIKSLVSDLETKLSPIPTGHFTSAEFAIEMLETAQEGIFTVNDSLTTENPQSSEVK